MMPLAWSLFYTVLGGAVLCAGAFQGDGLLLFGGACWLAMAAWEVLASIRARRTGRSRPCPPLSLNLSYVLLALFFVYNAVRETTGSNVFMAVCWSILGLLYAVKAVRQLRTGNKEEVES